MYECFYAPSVVRCSWSKKRNKPKNGDKGHLAFRITFCWFEVRQEMSWTTVSTFQPKNAFKEQQLKKSMCILYRLACSSQYLSNSTKIPTNTETEMLSNFLVLEFSEDLVCYFYLISWIWCLQLFYEFLRLKYVQIIYFVEKSSCCEI